MPQSLPMATAVEPKTASDAWDEKTHAFLKDARGVIHVGANIGQEKDVYRSFNLPVIWIEPLNGIFEHLCKEIADYPMQAALQYLVTDVDGKEYSFGVSNNGAQSSSIFPFADHKQIWPDVDYIGCTYEKSVTLKTVIERDKINMSLFDALIMDVQGAELLVLQGAGEYLDRFRWIRAECADFEIYEGCCQLKDLDAFLFARGYERAELWKGRSKVGVGSTYEALYRRKDEEYR